MKKIRNNFFGELLMLSNRLEKIRKRLASLSIPGPWAYCNYGEKCHSFAVGAAYPSIEGRIYPPCGKNDPDIVDEVCSYEGATGGDDLMEFIAYAPGDIAFLLSELDRIKAKNNSD